MTGVVDIVGDLKLEGSHTVTSQKIGSLDVTTVASHYNYASDTHTVSRQQKILWIYQLNLLLRRSFSEPFCGDLFLNR